MENRISKFLTSRFFTNLFLELFFLYWIHFYITMETNLQSLLLEYLKIQLHSASIQMFRRSPFFTWRVEISSVKQGKNHPTHIKNYSSKSNQQLVNRAHKDFFSSSFIDLLCLQFHCDIRTQFINFFLHLCSL